MRGLGMLPGDAGSWAVGINERGQVIGVSGGDVNRPFVWQNGRMRAGQVAIADWDDTVTRIWGNGKTTRLPLLPADHGGAAISLNERNHVVGVSCTLHGSLDAHNYSWQCHLYSWQCHLVMWTRQGA